MRIVALFLLLTLLVISPVSAAYFVNQTNSITFKNTLGLLIPLGIEHFVPPADAIMYYNYISIGLILVIFTRKVSCKIFQCTGFDTISQSRFAMAGGTVFNI